MKKLLSTMTFACGIALLTISCAKNTAEAKPSSTAEVALNPPGDGPICGVSKMWGKKPGDSECTCYVYDIRPGSSSEDCEWFAVDNSICTSAGLPNTCGQ